MKPTKQKIEIFWKFCLGGGNEIYGKDNLDWFTADFVVVEL